LLGVEPRTVIKYRQQGKVRGDKQGKAWRLWLSQDFIDASRPERAATHSGRDPERSAARSGTPAGPIEAEYQVTPVAIEQAVARTSAQYMGDLRTMLAEVGKVYEGQLAAKDQALSMQTAALVAKDETIAELRRRAEVAEVERDRLAIAQAAPAAPGALEAPIPDDPSGAPSAGFWARVRRMFGGG